MHGAEDWSTCAASMGGTRTEVRCRQRWLNVLDPSINHGPWSLEEDKILIDTHKKVGNKWAEIARLLPGRTDISVKKRWISQAFQRKHFNL